MDRHPTFSKLAAKQEELTTREHQLKTDDQQVRWKEKTIRGGGASDTYEWIQLLKNNTNKRSK